MGCPEDINQDDMDVEEKYRIRGYIMKKNDQFVVNLSEEEGSFLLTNTATGEPKIEKNTVRKENKMDDINKLDDDDKFLITQLFKSGNKPNQIAKKLGKSIEVINA